MVRASQASGPRPRQSLFQRRRVCTAVALVGSAAYGGKAISATFSGPTNKPSTVERRGNVDRLDTIEDAAEAWFRTLRRVATGKKIRKASVVAWLKTLRLVAPLIGVNVIMRRRLATTYPAPPEAVAQIEEAMTSRPAESEKPRAMQQEGQQVWTDRDASEAVRALARLELPFFATSAEFVTEPSCGLKVSGNLRPSATDDVGQVVDTLRELLELALRRSLDVRLLRDEDSTAIRYCVFVTLASEPPTDLDFGSILLSVASLACVYEAGMSLDPTSTASVLLPGSAFPMGAAVGLLIASEVVRSAVGRRLDARVGFPIFLPSPQLGVVASYAKLLTPPKTRGHALAIALSGPLALVKFSCLLALYGELIGSGSQIALHTPLHIAWPGALLPVLLDPLVWAGAQGLLMASLMLLPHSPDGRAAWQALCGKKVSDALAVATQWTYPFLGVLAVFLCGPSWQILPIWWAFLMFNFAPRKVMMPIEEVTDLPAVVKVSVAFFLCCAMICAVPLPLNTLAAEVTAWLAL